MTALPIVRSELILGGQRSGKSRRAEMLAQQWLAASPDHDAVFIATARPWDDEMRERIAQHQQDRAERLPCMRTVEEPLALAESIASSSSARTLIVVDCLTLWLTNLLMPASLPDKAVGWGDPDDTRFLPDSMPKEAVGQYPSAPAAMVLKAIAASGGPVVLVSNEIGLGVVPMGRDTRRFVDALGRLNQDTARTCERVTLMAAGLPLILKGQS
jgi:adenosylcobinamide kinase / adenosylcobinamide-phosphate guanylyltransferase